MLRLVLLTVGILTACPGFSICINNLSDYKIYYEIRNENFRCPIPKVRFHSGTLNAHEKKCHAHDSSQGNDWKIYRKDDVKIFKIESNGMQKLVCSRKVEGILNFLEVEYLNSHWWCLDASDYED